MDGFTLSRLAPIGVSILVALLAYGSQVFFFFVEGPPLEQRQLVLFNILVTCIWICYARACFTDPGRVPKDWTPFTSDRPSTSEEDEISGRRRWCKRCEAFKPPRAHHCKTCQRCIPKMDHHCPWTINCVSHRTFPHFLRFLFYCVASMSYLQYFLYLRGAAIWIDRDLPSYLGPSAADLIILFVLFLLNSITLFALCIMFLRTIWSLITNVTTIESWEIERHETLLRRAKTFGGYLDGPDGTRIRIRKQEFPYDVGLWKNIVQGMSGGPLTRLWPLASTPSLSSGLYFEVNGFEDADAVWPPPDPDRMPRRIRTLDPSDAFTHEETSNSNEDVVQAFRKRQEEDLKRRHTGTTLNYRRRPFHERYDTHQHDATESNGKGSPGEEAWKNSEGDRLDDFGVDEDVEFYDEDNIPLAQLLRQRRDGDMKTR